MLGAAGVAGFESELDDDEPESEEDDDEEDEVDDPDDVFDPALRESVL